MVLVKILPDDVTFACGMCFEQYKEEDMANRCEMRHEERKDLHYLKYLDGIEKEKLAEAAKHPSQKRLI